MMGSFPILCLDIELIEFLMRKGFGISRTNFFVECGISGVFSGADDLAFKTGKMFIDLDHIKNGSH